MDPRGHSAHLAVRASGHDRGISDYTILAGSPTIRGSGSVQNGPGGGGGKAVAWDENASKRGHNYVTIFIDLDRKQSRSSSLPPAKAAWSCSAVSCVSVAAIATRYHRDGLRHVASLSDRHWQKLPRRQRHRGLVPCSPTLCHRHGRSPKGRG
ncbi:hypothetical protein DFAR_3340011 [Desulfarculales bacterium]